MIPTEFYGCLYCHTNLINGKKYWGITTKKNAEYRWNRGKGYVTSTHFYSAILKYGWDNFQHDVVGYFTTKQELDAAEIYWIKATRSNEKDYGYNLSKGADSGNGFYRKNRPLTEEHKKKIGDANRGKKLTYIKEFSQETRDKLSKSRIGKKLSLETREKLRKLSTGRIMSEESRKKMSDSAKNRKSKEKSFNEQDK